MGGVPQRTVNDRVRFRATWARGQVTEQTGPGTGTVASGQFDRHAVEEEDMEEDDIYARTMPVDDLFDSGPFRMDILDDAFSLEKAATPDPDPFDRPSDDPWKEK